MSSIQRILPRSRAGWQKQNPALLRSGQTEGKKPDAHKPVRAPPKPGTGKVVDRDA